EQGWLDLQKHRISARDVLIGIAASGTTPYVVGAVEQARKHGIATGAITMNPGSPLALAAQYPVVVVVGPEFVTGSSRMKAGTAQKLVLNMISTALMIRVGRVKGNKMVNMQLSNTKLVDRGTRYIMEELGLNYEDAEKALKEYGSVKRAIDALR
ncbi:MAG: N-acetylmuramic acid 6-phosphate etherase, partial [Flavobacteriia bacterium]